MADSQWTIEPGDAGLRLDKFLAGERRLGSRSRAAGALRSGKVFLNDEPAGLPRAGTRLAEGDRVRVWLDRPGSGKKRAAAARAQAIGGRLRIVHEDDVLLVVDKPAGLLTVPAAGSREPSIEDLAGAHLRAQRRRPFVVHRIDKDTSGLVVFAKDPQTQRQMKAQFAQRDPERVYLAVVYGHPDPPEGTWRDRLVWDGKAMVQRETHPRDPAGKDAACAYRVLEDLDGAALIEVRLETGKRNQIRVQARLRGHTLVGEQRYTFGPATLRPIEFPRQALHAHRLAFVHPESGRTARFEAPLPEDMRDLIERLR